MEASTSREFRWLWFARFTPLLVAACVSPTASGSVATAASPAGESVTSPGGRLVIWDGAHIRPRNIGTGAGARMGFWDGGASWADCDSKPQCKSSLIAVDHLGVSGGKGLKFHAEGSGWLGSGWSWFAWYPATAGTDLRPYRSLTFQIRVEASSPELAPEPGMVAVSLVSTGKRGSTRAKVEQYDPSFYDGKWHRIVIPIADLTTGKAPDEFDLEKVSEFQLSTWSAAARNFDIYVDEIGALK